MPPGHALHPRVDHLRAGGNLPTGPKLAQPGQQLGGPGLDLFGGQIGHAGLVGHQHPQLVGTGQHQGGQLGAHRDLVIAQAVEHVLDHVGKGFHRRALDHPGRTLDGVGRTEDAVEGGLVVGAGFQLEQQRL